MSKFTDFPRNTKQAYIKSCAQAAREAAIRAQQMEQAYQEHTPVQNTDELIKFCVSSDTVLSTEQREGKMRELGIDLSRRKVAA